MSEETAVATIELTHDELDAILSCFYTNRGHAIEKANGLLRQPEISQIWLDQASAYKNLFDRLSPVLEKIRPDRLQLGACSGGDGSELERPDRGSNLGPQSVVAAVQKGVTPE